jgi:hypothetical protein
MPYQLTLRSYYKELTINIKKQFTNLKFHLVFENRVLKRIFGPKSDKVTGEWRTLHNEQLHDLYSSPSIIRIVQSRRMRWAGHVARMGEKRNVYRLLGGSARGEEAAGKTKTQVGG